jgi:hypothetical protein
MPSRSRARNASMTLSGTTSLRREDICQVAALWMTIDLDYQGVGVIRVSNLPFVETLAAMN